MLCFASVLRVSLVAALATNLLATESKDDESPMILLPINSKHHTTNPYDIMCSGLEGTTIVIPQINPQNHPVFDFLFSVLSEDYDTDMWDDLSEKEKREVNMILQPTSESNPYVLSATGLDSPLNFLAEAKHMSHDLALRILPWIDGIINEFKRKSLIKIRAWQMALETVVQCNKNTLYVTVFPEAFSNTFYHRSKCGRFIPFSASELEPILHQLSIFTSKHPNLAIFYNVVHCDKPKTVSDLKVNFDDYRNNNCFQAEILKSYYNKSPGSKCTPIYNETFVFFRGDQVRRYKKQRILDEDLFMVQRYFEKNIYHMYVPGGKPTRIVGDSLNTYAIQICDDHRNPIDISYQRRDGMPRYTLILQSSTINTRADLASLFIGLFIHSDMELHNSLVYDINERGGILKHQYYNIRVGGCDGFFKIYNLTGDEK